MSKSSSSDRPRAARSPHTIRSGARPAVASLRAAALFPVVALLAAAAPAAADVVRDGRIGSAGAGAVATEADGSGGLRYLIRESDGQRAGNNLFHSFSHFDLTQNETAVYQGSAGIRNLITMITGGGSTIDGKLKSEIDGANLYLINPQGVVFGEHATVDLTGALTVSTADRLVFANGDTLATSGGPPPVLSIADPTGFGFLGPPAPISIRGSRIELSVDPAFRLIGGDLAILGGRSDDRAAYVAVRAGRIDLVSLASAGEVEIVADGVDVSGAPRFGDITIADDVIVTSGGVGVNALDEFNESLLPAEGSGPIYIRADDLLIRSADLRTTTVTSRAGGDISIDLSGRLTIDGSDREALSGIFSGTGLNVDPPEGAHVDGTFILTLIDRNGEFIGEIAFDICGSSACGAHYFATGDAGAIRVRAKDVRISNGGEISASSEFSGDAGTIDIGFEDEMVVTGRRPSGQISLVTTNANGTGNPGSILVHSDAGVLRLDDFGGLVIQNGRFSPENGLPGRIEIDVEELEMAGNARIDSSTRGAGPGGILDITADERITLEGRTDDENFTGISTLSQPGSTGAAGAIRVATRDLLMTDGAEISARPADATSLGAAGNLRFEIGDRLVLRDATISTESPNAAGGNIELGVSGVADLLRSSITTSVTSGPESGGNVTLRPGPSGLVLDHSRIVAQADAGAGGFIDLEAGVVITDPSSSIDASSATGIDGVVLINGVEGNVVPEVAQLATPSADASSLVREPCAARRPGSSNRFVVDDRERLAVDADDYLAAPVSRLLAARTDERGEEAKGSGRADSAPVGVLLAADGAMRASSCYD